ncbi:YfiR family protein [Pseudomonas sp. PB3P13]
MDAPGPDVLRKRYLGTILLVLCALSSFAAADPAGNSAQRRAATVTQVIMGIFSYARWPADLQQIRLCVVGPTEYADDLMNGAKQSAGRPVVVRRLLVNDPQLPAECDALYIGVLTPHDRSNVFAALTGLAVLSVSEQPDQCTVGSAFCLQVSDSQVGFEINLDSVARSGVRIHPNVLQLSRHRTSIQ